MANCQEKISVKKFISLKYTYLGVGNVPGIKIVLKRAGTFVEKLDTTKSYICPEMVSAK